MVRHIYAHSTDGFGHQLEGLFTTLIVHGVNNNYFDGNEFISKIFNFEHVNSDESMILRKYLIEVASKFIIDFTQSKINYKEIIRSHEYYHIPENYNEEILYSLDNIFGYKDLFNSNELTQINKNINLMKKYFINKQLPCNRLTNKSIVIHMRMGDALFIDRGQLIREHNLKVIKLIDIFKVKYPDYHYYIHSDGNPSEIIDKIGYNYTFYNSNTQVLDVLSDIIYSKIFVCSVSSLSNMGKYLGNKELIIKYDNNEKSLPDNTFMISDYIEKYSN